MRNDRSNHAPSVQAIRRTLPSLSWRLFVAVIIAVMVLRLHPHAASAMSDGSNTPTNKRIRRIGFFFIDQRRNNVAVNESLPAKTVSSSRGGASQKGDAERPRHLQRGPHHPYHNAIQYLKQNKKRIFYLFVFCFFSCDTVDSIWEDQWYAERGISRGSTRGMRVGRLFGWKHSLPETKSRQIIVKKRVTKDKTLRNIIGTGYTPRLVFLFGVMMRGIINCTAIPKIFNPHMGYGAGCVLAANFAHREWIPAIMIGWFGSGYYWKSIFNVNGPPKTSKLTAKGDDDGVGDDDEPFSGVPITINKVRLF